MSNIEMIQILLILLLLFIFILFYLLHLARKQIEMKQKYSIYQVRSNPFTGSFYVKVYDSFINIPLTKRYFNKVKCQFEIIMPGDRRQIAISTTKTILLSWIIDVAMIGYLFVLKPSFYNGILSIIYIFFVNHQIVNFSLSKSDMKLLKQLEKFLENMRHYYQEHEIVDEAIYDAMEHTDYPVKLHLSHIHKILTSEEMEEEVIKYNENIPNRFLKTFLAICVMILKYGDKRVENRSLFMTNIKYLRQEINIEILSREKINFLFSGLIFVAIMPIFFLQGIKNWAISSFAGLKDYYYGAFGILTLVLIFVITFVSYHGINRLKENLRVEVKNYTLLCYFTRIPFIKKHLEIILNKNYGKTLRLQALLKQVGESITPVQFLLKRFLYSFLAFLCCILLSFSIHWGRKEQLLKDTDNISYVSSMLSENQIVSLKHAVLDYVGRYKNKTISLEEVELSLMEEKIFKSKHLATMTAHEVVHRIKLYQMEYYKWYELLIAIGVAVMAFHTPYLQLILLKKLRQMVMDDEVIQFQSIILMIMFIDRMTVETILEWMENFASIFKSSIQDCINDLQSGEIEALDELIQKEPFEPFASIIEKLKASDKIGIEKAFDEIAVERFNYQEKRKLENEILITSKINYATMMAWMPFITTISLYLIIPFMIEGFTQLMTYLNQMNQL